MRGIKSETVFRAGIIIFSSLLLVWTIFWIKRLIDNMTFFLLFAINVMLMLDYFQKLRFIKLNKFKSLIEYHGLETKIERIQRNL